MQHDQRAFRSFWSQPDAPLSLGCVGCPFKAECGGQKIAGDGFNCLDHCCGQPASCQVVCPRAHVFTDRWREVRGFPLETPRAKAIPAPSFVSYLPLIFHGSSRNGRLAAPAIAIPLYRFFDRNADCRFQTPAAVCSEFRLHPGAKLFLTGVAQDKEVEHWWKLERAGRIKAIANLRRLGVAMVTTPNFSLMVDRPRTDDLHSIKRIAEVHHEFLSEGQAAALHVNGRTEHDFERWGEYIAAHPEVTHLAYEFTTGTRNPGRMRQHAAWLATLALASPKRLGLILRGGTHAVADLAQHFDISFIDSSPFTKAHHRQVAVLSDAGQRWWMKHPTAKGAPVDLLLNANLRVSEQWYGGLLPSFPLAA